jgi:hypothetical protein
VVLSRRDPNLLLDRLLAAEAGKCSRQAILTLASALLNVQNDVGLSGLDIAQIQLALGSLNYQRQRDDEEKCEVSAWRAPSYVRLE